MTTRTSESKTEDFNTFKVIIELNIYFDTLPEII